MTAAHSDEDILAVAKLVDPPAFSDRYEPVLPSRHERWLTNKNRRIRAAIAKADRILALIATPAGDTVTVPRDLPMPKYEFQNPPFGSASSLAAAPTTPAGASS